MSQALATSTLRAVATHAATRCAATALLPTSFVLAKRIGDAHARRTYYDGNMINHAAVLMAQNQMYSLSDSDSSKSDKAAKTKSKYHDPYHTIARGPSRAERMHEHRQEMEKILNRFREARIPDEDGLARLKHLEVRIADEIALKKKMEREEMELGPVRKALRELEEVREQNAGLAESKLRLNMPWLGYLFGRD